jgi:hypothetical protein
MTTDAGGAGSPARARLPGFRWPRLPSPRRERSAGTAGAASKSIDGGATLSRPSDFGDVRSPAFDAGSATVYAALESGVRRSGDAGVSWQEAGPLPARALALSIEPAAPGAPARIYAATAGAGLVVSADGGATWLASRLPPAFLTDVALAGGAIFAASPDGVFASRDSGRSWKLARIGAVESLAAEAPETLLSAGAAGIHRSGDRGAKWSSNEDLSAHRVRPRARSRLRSALRRNGQRPVRLDADGENGALLPGARRADVRRPLRSIRAAGTGGRRRGRDRAELLEGRELVADTDELGLLPRSRSVGPVQALRRHAVRGAPIRRRRPDLEPGFGRHREGLCARSRGRPAEPFDPVRRTVGGGRLQEPRRRAELEAVGPGAQARSCTGSRSSHRSRNDLRRNGQGRLCERQRGKELEAALRGLPGAPSTRCWPIPRRQACSSPEPARASFSA